MLNSNITNVQRNQNEVILTVNSSAKTYDFLIWSPELKRNLHKLKPYKEREWKAFGSTRTDYLVSTLIALDGGMVFARTIFDCILIVA